MSRPTSTPSTGTIDDWIAREAIAFSAETPGSFEAALDRMMDWVGDGVELLAFGEAVHGAQDLLILRNRLFQHLVEQHGYRAIAVESSFPRGCAVDNYVHGHGGDSYEAVQEVGFSHGFGRLDANRELVEWMRRYNASAPPAAQLRFYGFDSPTEMTGTDSPRQLLHVPLDYLSRRDPAGAQERRRRIDELLGADAEWENPAAMMDPSQSIGLSPAANALRIEAEELLTALRLHRPDFPEADEAEYLEAAHHAAMARQLLSYHAALARSSPTRLVELLGMRDLMMADTLAYAVSRERGRGKVLAFAHNSHLKHGQARWQLGPHDLAWWPAGAHLGRVLGSRYAVVGSGIGVSEANGIAPPEPETLEARLTAVRGWSCVIPTHSARRLSPSALAAVPLRTGSTRNSTYFPLTSNAFTDFDALLFLTSTTYTRGGPPLPDPPPAASS